MSGPVVMSIQHVEKLACWSVAGYLNYQKSQLTARIMWDWTERTGYGVGLKQ